MRSRDQHQRSLPPMELRGSESNSPALRKSESHSPAVGSSEEDAGYALGARLFVAALNHPKYGLSRDEVAFVVGVSRSLVDKWCDESFKSCPSQVQLLRLPVTFQLALRDAMDDHFGHRREALKRLVDVVGDVALAMGS